MSLYCGYCHRLFSRVDSRIRHEKHSCQRKENPEDIPETPHATENQNRFPNGIEFGEAFRFRTPSSILVVGSSGCGKTCFTELLLLDHFEELFLSPPPTIHYCYGVWQDGFQNMKDAGVHLHEGIPETDHLKSWLLKVGLLVLDDLMAEGDEDKEILDLLTKHSQHEN